MRPKNRTLHHAVSARTGKRTKDGSTAVNESNQVGDTCYNRYTANERRQKTIAQEVCIGWKRRSIFLGDEQAIK